MRPTVALPTGPFDWHPERHPKVAFEQRIEAFRDRVMGGHVTHAVVHGNGFDHEALSWLSHFTPKLGPAYLLIPRTGPLRLLFSGGPGMKPSAAALTWIEDVAALRGIGGDIKAWLGSPAAGRNMILGLVEGRSMLLGDFRAVEQAAGGSIVSLDEPLATLRASIGTLSQEAAFASELAKVAGTELQRRALVGSDLRTVILDTERALYAGGAQDVRILASIALGGEPTSWADAAGAVERPTTFEVHVRADGEWASARVKVG